MRDEVDSHWPFSRSGFVCDFVLTFGSDQIGSLLLEFILGFWAVLQFSTRSSMSWPSLLHV